MSWWKEPWSRESGLKAEDCGNFYKAKSAICEAILVVIVKKIMCKGWDKEKV